MLDESACAIKCSTGRPHVKAPLLPQCRLACPFRRMGAQLTGNHVRMTVKAQRLPGSRTRHERRETERKSDQRAGSPRVGELWAGRCCANCGRNYPNTARRLSFEHSWVDVVVLRGTHPRIHATPISHTHADLGIATYTLSALLAVLLICTCHRRAS